MARPSKYKEEYAEQAYKLCLLGATDKDLADFFETSEQTVNSWKKNQPGFFESLKQGKRIADARVAEKLYQRAMGYEYEEKTYEAIKIGKDKTPAQNIKTVIKQVAPDTTAQIFWLKNRQPDKWRDKHDYDHSGELGVKIIDNIPTSDKK